MTHDLDDVLKELDDAIAINKDAQVNAYLWAMDEKLRAYIERTSWKPIEEAPRDGTEIFVYAKWNWGRSINYGKYSPRLAKLDDCHFEYDEDGNEKAVFSSVTSNPYTDYAYNPTHFKYLDAPPTTTEGE